MFAFALGTLLLQSDLQSDLSSLIDDPALAQATIGIYVKQIDGNVIFKFNEDKRLIPASNTKLFTAALVWNTFSSSETVCTRAWRVGNSIFLKGFGDPSLTAAELQQIKKLLAVSSADRLYFDDTLFGSETFNPSWQIADIEGGEGPAVTALTVNRGIAEVWVKNGKIELRPDSFGMRVKSSLKDGPETTRVNRKFGSWEINVSGTFPKVSPEKRLANIVLPDPGLCAARLICKNAVRRPGLIPPQEAIVFSPKKIDQLLQTMLTESYNLFAEVLLRLCSKDGTREQALVSLEGLLSRFEILPTDWRLVDGSGVSRYNEVTPRAIVSLLEHCYFDNPDRVLSALAKPSEGTLKGRLNGVKVWAKTGTLLGVSCLSGIVEAPSCRYIFCILMNHLQPDSKRAREIQDAIVSRLSKGTYE